MGTLRWQRRKEAFGKMRRQLMAELATEPGPLNPTPMPSGSVAEAPKH